MKKNKIFALVEDSGKKENRIILSIINSLFWISLLTMITALIGTTLDGFIVTHFLGEKEFGAFGLAGPLINLIEMAGSIIATGTVVVCSNLIGGGEAKEANKIFHSGLTLCLIVGIALAAFFAFFPQTARVLSTKKNAEEFLPLLYPYVRGLAFGIPAMMLCTLFIPIVQLDGGKTRVAIAAWVLCIANVGGDILSVKLTNLGMLGIGLVTSISYYLSAVVLFMHFLRHKSAFHPGLSFYGLNKTLPYGVPPLFNRSATMLRNQCYNTFALLFGGPVGMVAWTAVNTLSSFLSGFPKGFGQESLVGSGVFYGEKDKNTLKRFMKYSFAFAFLVISITIAILYFTAPFLIRIYIKPDSPSFKEAVFGLRWYAFGLLPMTFNAILANYMQSSGKKIFTNIIMFMDGFGMLAIYALFLLKIIGFHGLWYTFFLGKATVFIAALLFIFIRQKTFKLNMETLLMLPGDFDVPDTDTFSVTISNNEEAVGVYSRIIEFCKAKGLHHRCCYFIGLALEEMSTIIIKEGFGDGKPHTIDIKIFVVGDMVTIRLRDDCKYFDTNKRMEIMNPEDPMSNAGIRVLNTICESTDYYSALNVNFLTMKLNCASIENLKATHKTAGSKQA